MLQSKNTLLRKGQKKEEKVIWRTPVILDMKAFQHCGSPHFKPLAYGALKDFVGVLSDWGIEVIGVTNITRNKASTNQYTNANDGPTKTSEIGTDIEAAQLELPILMGKTGRSLANSQNEFEGSLGIENLIQSISIWNNLISSHMADTPHRSSASFAGKESDLLLEQLKSFSTSTFKKKDINRRAIRAKDKPIDSSVIVEESQQLNMSATNVMNEDESLPSDHKIYRGSVRSGQQISTDKPNQSLIVIGNVNSGGEVMADGDIHVYGTLRGRALAGLSPNKNKGSDAKIFASIFDAELVCIGQTFTTVDSLEDLGLESHGGAIVSFESCKGNLCFEGF
jgi:septum site-determining protein MinC